mmetsp:Transcript_45355/g.112765  ORF Transcript_45355/g.112765 Transcript_45355/m.112765 type:complete len:365 (+) Transcript_45355:97-1191(+)
MSLRADRRLARVAGIERQLQRTLEAAGFVTCRDILGVSVIELIEALDVDLDQACHLADVVAAEVAAKPRTAHQLLSRMSETSYLRTGIRPLDAHLGGGLPHRCVVEAVGPAGIGKTQFCLAVAARALVDGASDGRRVVHIDTAHNLDLSTKRLTEMLELLLNEQRRDSPVAHSCTVAELASRLLVWRPDGWDEYCHCLKELEIALLAAPARVTLIIVDSVAAPVRAHFYTKDQRSTRQEQLVAHTALLKYLADTHDLCVLVTNQVQGSGDRQMVDFASSDCVSSVLGRDEARLVCCLGTVWAHSVNIRLVLERKAGWASASVASTIGIGWNAAESQEIRVAKAPMCANCERFGYKVGPEGLRSC